MRSLFLLVRDRDFERVYKYFRDIATRSYIANCEDENVADIKQFLVDWPSKLLYNEYKESSMLTNDDLIDAHPRRHMQMCILFEVSF